MKDSFLSFKDINAEKWVINIRGKFKNEAAFFLKENLNKKLILFELESEEGWFYDTRKMLNVISADYVFFWIEDHVNMVKNYNLYDEIFLELKEHKVDFMPYTFFGQGQSYYTISKKQKRIYTAILNKKTWRIVLRYSPNLFILYMGAIFSRDLFNRIVLSDDPYQHCKWPKETPFDFEKTYRDTHWLPLKVAYSFSELFAVIDTDHECYSLISRGLYPDRGIKRIEAAGLKMVSENKPSKEKLIFNKIKQAITSVRLN